MTPLLDHHRQSALDRGIPHDVVEELWAKHVAWCAQCAPPRDAGGLPWVRFCETVVADDRRRAENFDTKQAQLQRRARQRAREREIKEAEDREYARTAISFDQWMETMRQRHAMGDKLTAHELALITAEPIRDDQSIGGWLFDTVFAKGPKPASAAPRMTQESPLDETRPEMPRGEEWPF